MVAYLLFVVVVVVVVIIIIQIVFITECSTGWLVPCFRLLLTLHVP